MIKFKKKKKKLICNLGKNNVVCTNGSIFKSSLISIEGDDNYISATSSNFENLNITIIGNGNVIDIGEGAVINETNIFMRGNNHKLILKKCIIQKGIFWYEDNGSIISIGEGTSIVCAAMSVMDENTKISIGKDCMLANDITIRTSDSHSIIDLETNKRINPSKDVNIGNHVWIGAYTSVLKGATVSDNSIVGLHSVVTEKSICPENSLLVGVPAKVVKSNVTWHRERLKDL